MLTEIKLKELQKLVANCSVKSHKPIQSIILNSHINGTKNLRKTEEVIHPRTNSITRNSNNSNNNLGVIDPTRNLRKIEYVKANQQRIKSATKASNNSEYTQNFNESRKILKEITLVNQGIKREIKQENTTTIYNKGKNKSEDMKIILDSKLTINKIGTPQLNPKSLSEYKNEQFSNNIYHNEVISITQPLLNNNEISDNAKTIRLRNNININNYINKTKVECSPYRIKIPGENVRTPTNFSERKISPLRYNYVATDNSSSKHTLRYLNKNQIINKDFNGNLVIDSKIKSDENTLKIVMIQSMLRRYLIRKKIYNSIYSHYTTLAFVKIFKKLFNKKIFRNFFDIFISNSNVNGMKKYLVTDLNNKKTFNKFDDCIQQVSEQFTFNCKPNYKEDIFKNLSCELISNSLKKEIINDYISTKIEDLKLTENNFNFISKYNQLVKKSEEFNNLTKTIDQIFTTTVVQFEIYNKKIKSSLEIQNDNFNFPVSISKNENKLLDDNVSIELLNKLDELKIKKSQQLEELITNNNLFLKSLIKIPYSISSNNGYTIKSYNKPDSKYNIEKVNYHEFILSKKKYILEQINNDLFFCSVTKTKINNSSNTDNEVLNLQNIINLQISNSSNKNKLNNKVNLTNNFIIPGSSLKKEQPEIEIQNINRETPTKEISLNENQIKETPMKAKKTDDTRERTKKRLEEQMAKRGIKLKDPEIINKDNKFQQSSKIKDMAKFLENQMLKVENDITTEEVKKLENISQMMIEKPLQLKKKKPSKKLIGLI